MKIVSSIKEMAAFSCMARDKGRSIGFVPTMGALHEGHLSLVRRSRRDNDITVVSIFVNPIQFGPGEDYARYPRDLKRDAGLCRREGVDMIFYPRADQLYPCGYATYVSVDGLSDILCGKFRPGHFKGVATVVTKLFNIIAPDRAYFGQKDAQQAAIIKKLSEDLNMRVKINVMPTFREKDGLAASSRNAYLNKKEREDARVLYQALTLAKQLVRRGCTDTGSIIAKMKQAIASKRSARVQYIAIVDPGDLKPLNRIKGKALVALGVWIGKTRLIDNAVVGR
ncbi:MAG: pantoate--beta-alanine ligase [Candidatus Omnitrophota bacterium]|jgi:pantoate--beta-alanine ligase